MNRQIHLDAAEYHDAAAKRHDARARAETGERACRQIGLAARERMLARWHRKQAVAENPAPVENGTPGWAAAVGAA